MSTEVMSGGDEAVSNWCSTCEDLRQEVEKLQAEHALNYKALKDKIISTDKLIKRYTAKCQEYDIQSKKLEETSKLLQDYKCDCENFESQLKTALEELAPLKQNNQKYEKLCSSLEKKVDKYEVKLQAAESTQKQFSLAQQQLERESETIREEKSMLDKRVKELEGTVKKNDASLKKLQDELDTKKKEITALKKENTSYKTQAGKLQMRTECWTELLRNHGLLTKGRQMYGRWMREASGSKVNELVESDDEDSLQNFMQESQGTSSAGAGDASVARKDSLVEMILTEMTQDGDNDDLELCVFEPLSPAVSPLRQSPSSEDEGHVLTSDEDFTDIADQLEQSLRRSKTKKSQKGTGKGKKSSKGKMKVIESALGPQGILEIQESLSDTEQDGETDVPFTRIGVKTRSNSRSQDDGVFKEPLPVSPLRTRRRRGGSVSQLDPQPPLINTRVTRSCSFPTAVAPHKAPPIFPLIPLGRAEPGPSISTADNNKKEKECEKNDIAAEQNEKQQTDKSEKGQRILRKRKGSFNSSDSESEDLTISRRSLRSSSTSSDEGSGEDTPRSQRRSPRLGSRSGKVMSPPSRLTRSRRTTEDGMNDKVDSKENVMTTKTEPGSGTKPIVLKHEQWKKESFYKGFVKGGILIPGATMSEQREVSESGGQEVTRDSDYSEDLKMSNSDTSAADGASSEADNRSAKVTEEAIPKTKEDGVSDASETVSLHPHVPSESDVSLESESQEEKYLVNHKSLTFEDVKDAHVKSKVLRRQDSIHSEISSRGSNSVCDMDTLIESDDVSMETNKKEADSMERDESETQTAEADKKTVSESEKGGCNEHSEAQTSPTNCDKRNVQVILLEPDSVKDIKGANYNSIETRGQTSINGTAINDSQSKTIDSCEQQSSHLDMNDNVEQNSDRSKRQDETLADVTDESNGKQTDRISESETPPPELGSQDDRRISDIVTLTKSGTIRIDISLSQETSPSTSSASLAESDTSVIKGVRCKVVTDSSPAFTRLVNQGSTGFVPICAGDLLSPITPFSPNVAVPPSLLRAESDDSTRAESKSSDGSSELQGLIGNRQVGDNRDMPSVSPRDSGSSLEVRFYTENVNDDKVQDVEEESLQDRDPESRQDDGSLIGDQDEGSDEPQIDDAPDESSDEGNMDLMDDMSDQQSVLSSLPPSEAGDDDRVSPVSSLSTSGSTRSIPLSPLPFSDTESLCDPISPLPPTPERQLLRTPTPIDGTRVSPRPSCSNQPCTPPTPNTPPQANVVKERNPVKLLAIKNLQRQLSSEGLSDSDANNKVVNGAQTRKSNRKAGEKKSAKGKGQPKGQPKGQLPTRSGQNKQRTSNKDEGQVKVKTESDVHGQTDRLSHISESETVSQKSDKENNETDLNSSENAVKDGLKVQENIDNIKKNGEEQYEPPVRIAKGRRVSRIQSSDKNNPQEAVTSLGGTGKRKVARVVVEKLAVPKSEKDEKLDPSGMELPAQIRTFKRRTSRFGQRQMGVEKNETSSDTQEMNPEKNLKDTEVKKEPSVKAEVCQPVEDVDDSPAVPTGKKRFGRAPKRKVSESATHPETAVNDVDPTSKGRSDNADVAKKSKPSNFKAVDCELQFLIRLKAVNYKSIADRLAQLSVTCDQLVLQIIGILEKNGTDQLNALLLESNKVKDTWVRSSWQPIMAEHEVKVVQLILQINSTVMPNLAQEFIASGGRYIKSNKNVLISVSLSRVIAGLLKQLGDWQWLRVVVYDLLIGGTNGYPSVLVAMAGVWPDPISKLDRRQSPNVVLDTMEFTVMSKLSGQRTKHTKVLQCLQNLVGWKEATVSLLGMSENLISKLLSTDKEGYEELLACRLLLVGQPWEWINNQFILGMLWPHLQSWVGGQNQAMTDQALQNLLSLLGEAAAKCPPHFSHSIEGLMKTLSALACGLPQIQVSEDVKKTCLVALLKLSPYDPLMVAVTCVNWVRGHHHDYVADSSLQQKIKVFTEFYKSRLQAIDLSVFNVQS